MNKINKNWIDKRVLRSVDNLKLWSDNPRLNSGEDYIRLSDFAEDLIMDDSDRKSFIDLVKSITELGFIAFDPIIVWKPDNGKLCVAEGNRRILALKLLRYPDKAPKSIRPFITKQALLINRNDIEKISVCIAPNIEDAEWYINQRHSTLTLQKSWSRIQQQRWLMDIYQKYNGDIEIISKKAKLTQPQLEEIMRILQIRDLIYKPQVRSLLTKEEFEKGISVKFPISILERFFNSAIAREKWGIEFEGDNIQIRSDEDSFLNAYAHLIKNIVMNTPQIKIDTRTITFNLEGILNELPKVSYDTNEIWNLKPLAIITTNNTPTPNNNLLSINNSILSTIEQKGDPNRKNLILSIYNINTDNYRLKGLFENMKKISLVNVHCIAASLRVFMDLAVVNYINSKNLVDDIESKNKKKLKDIILSQRLEYIKKVRLTSNSSKIVTKLLNPQDVYTLDILNGYVHGANNSCYLNKQFLNGFWDFLFPLFEEILDIHES